MEEISATTEADHHILAVQSLVFRSGSQLTQTGLEHFFMKQGQTSRASTRFIQFGQLTSYVLSNQDPQVEWDRVVRVRMHPQAATAARQGRGGRNNDDRVAIV